MRTLFEKVPLLWRIVVIVASGLAALALVIAHGSVLNPAIEGKLYNIIDFELAGSDSHASLILETWGVEGRDAAIDALRIDFGLLVAYSLFFFASCATVGSVLGGWPWKSMEEVGWRLAGMSMAAGALDAVENVALLRVLADFDSGTVSTGATAVARGAASLKFSILFLAVVYLLVGVGALVTRSLRSSGFSSGRS